MLNIALPIAFALVGGAFAMSFLRLLMGPDAADRILALDTLYINAIALLVRELPQACVGAGTVLNARDLDAVSKAGAAFAISPGVTDTLYNAAKDCATPLIPGIATAGELMRGLEHGWQRFKFFPAEASGGVAALKGFAGPLPMARFCPTGGIDMHKAPSYLALPNVACVGGSWMLPNDAIQARDWARIGQLAQAASQLAR